MQSRHLIDAIMRNTTVLIAHLSTAAGLRAPLTHVASQVFLELARELERQGVRQKVVADMFGMALRSYQKKTRRLLESQTERDRTLWEAVLDHVSACSPVTRRDLFDRFRYDDERDVAAVLRDLTSIGLVHASGRGDTTTYGLTSARDHEVMSAQEDAEAIYDLVWLQVYQRGPMAEEALLAELPGLTETKLRVALDRLDRDQRIELGDNGWRSSGFTVPVGAERGWEAAVLDHFQAVTGAIAAKLRTGDLAARESDTIGGATLTFELGEGHPFETEVDGLLESVRAQANEIWNRVRKSNEQPPSGAIRKRVWFYVGQNVQSDPRPEGGEQDDERER